jgi:hypothetical protein
VVFQLFIYECIDFGFIKDFEDGVCDFKLMAFFVKKFDQVFVGITSVKPSRDFTRPLGIFFLKS